jgi:hypothetical protein
LAWLPGSVLIPEPGLICGIDNLKFLIAQSPNLSLSPQYVIQFFFKGIVDL